MLIVIAFIAVIILRLGRQRGRIPAGRDLRLALPLALAPAAMATPASATATAMPAFLSDALHAALTLSSLVIL